MWWLIDSAPDFWGRGFEFESSLSHNDPDELQDHHPIYKTLKVASRLFDAQ